MLRVSTLLIGMAGLCVGCNASPSWQPPCNVDNHHLPAATVEEIGFDITSAVVTFPKASKVCTGRAPVVVLHNGFMVRFAPPCPHDDSIGAENSANIVHVYKYLCEHVQSFQFLGSMAISTLPSEHCILPSIKAGYRRRNMPIRDAASSSIDSLMVRVVLCS